MVENSLTCGWNLRKGKWISLSLFSFLFSFYAPDLSARVDAVKEENLKLKSENQVLGQYIENLMSASSVFQTTDTKSKRKWGTLRRSLESQASSWEAKPTAETWRGVCLLSRPGVFSVTVCARIWVKTNDLIKSINWLCHSEIAG